MCQQCRERMEALYDFQTLVTTCLSDISKTLLIESVQNKNHGPPTELVHHFLI